MRRAIDKTLDTSLWVILSGMAVVVSANVFCRYVLGNALSWGDEVAQILLVWLTFLGAAVAVREHLHYALNYASRKARGKVRQALFYIRQALTIVAVLVLLYFSAIVAIDFADVWIMPATEISTAFVYAACPVGCLFMAFYAFANIAAGQTAEDNATPAAAAADPQQSEGT